MLVFRQRGDLKEFQLPYETLDILSWVAKKNGIKVLIQKTPQYFWISDDMKGLKNTFVLHNWN